MSCSPLQQLLASQRGSEVANKAGPLHSTPIQSSHYSPGLLHAAESFLKEDQLFILAFERIWKNHWLLCSVLTKNTQNCFCTSSCKCFFFASRFFVNKNQRVYLMHINIHAAQPRLLALSSRCHAAPASFQNYQKRH